MLHVEEKVAIKIIKAKSNQNKHIVAPPQCQVERHLSNSEEEYEHIDFFTRRIPDQWSEVKGKDTKIASETIMAKSALQNYRNNTTTQPIEEKENARNATRVRFDVPRNNNRMQSKWCPIKRIRHEAPRNNNKMQSKWRRKLANRTTLKSERGKQINLLLQTEEIARLAATAAIEKKDKKKNYIYVQ